MKYKKLILGLDLGISSCGWAITAQTFEDKWILEDFGVRLFQTPEHPKDGTTNATMRRMKRSARRLIRRRKTRKKDLILLFEKINFINKQSLEAYMNKHAATNLVENFKREELYNPYFLRSIGVTEKLTQEELVWSLIHVANRRGYKDKFAFEMDGDTKKKETKLDTAIQNATIEPGLTLSQEIITNKKFRDPQNQQAILVRNKGGKENETNFQFLFARDDYKKEIDLLLKKQAEFYPSLTEEIRVLALEIIFRQRDFEDGPGPKKVELREKYKLKNKQFSKNFTQLEGRCTFLTNLSVGYKSSILFDLFHIISELSKISQFIEGNVELINEILTSFLYNEKNKRGKTLLKEILGKYIDDKNLINGNAYKNIELKTNYLNLLKDVFGHDVLKEIDIFNLENNIYHELGKIIHTNITPERKRNAINQWLVKHNINLLEEKLNLLLKPNPSLSTTARTSFTWMQKAINGSLEGIPYGKFQAQFIKEQVFELPESYEKRYQKYLNGDKKFEMFAPIIDPDLWRNPIVFRAINQTRKVIKALFAKYHYIDQINIELTRDMGMAFKDRKHLIDKQENNIKENAKAKEFLMANGITVNDSNILKYKLWIQQNKKSMYSGDEISIGDLTKPNVLQIDHIIPYSKLADDSFNNKVLVFNKENQEKGNRLANEYIKSLGEEVYKKYKNRVNYFLTQKTISLKKAEYLLCPTDNDEILEGFVSRNLNDTRYITRYVMNWLKIEFALQKRFGLAIPNVIALNGAVTSRFRRMWLRNSPWGLEKKVREITPWHHAVDAIIISNFNNFSEVQFANDIVMLINYKNKLSDKEWNELYDELIKKWTGKSNIYVPNIEKRLLSIKENQSSKSIHYSLIDNLNTIIDQRMPLELEKKVISQNIIDKKTKEEYLIKTAIPVFIGVKDPDEYLLQNKTMEGNIRYPFTSYKIEKKSSGDLLGSELPVSKKEPDLYKNNTLNNEKYFIDSKGTIWNNASYAFLNIWSDSTTKKGYNYAFVKFNDYLKNKSEYKNRGIRLYKSSLTRYQKDSKYEYKYYQSKMGNSIYANLLNTAFIPILEKNKKIFGKQNYYDSLSNWFKELELVQIDLLGNPTFVKI
ncbi:type II CRISPR RNA-guided endonuclease Cas9 [Spiroplasma sp. SV19]|uniref:type II CRISPR RNA-guided endonuclease Cas9 n=1 Tax=Spiroplasma sp. SV19 TaxID=2570468 RepID=UPI0024B82732|nr:type II CRISPR RNA-guided endonuclease Cas9 [Spiroplasma sp. SV19]